MRIRHIFTILVVALLFAVGQGQTGLAVQKQKPKQEDLGVTQTLRIMGKGSDHIVVGEKPLYVLPKISKITDRNGSTIRLGRLRTRLFPHPRCGWTYHQNPKPAPAHPATKPHC